MSTSSAVQYAKTRITSLKPPCTKVNSNPFKALSGMKAKQWNFFFCGFIAWAWDSFDFFTVILTLNALAKDFGRTKADITWGITLVLMLRSVGAIIFGLAADKWGRKWPFVINNILFIVLEIGTGFCTTYEQFLAVRALFGIAMGGIYGNATATALEDAPVEARGILSGLLQQGYSFGYLLAAVFARALATTTPYGWRPLFWFGGCPPVLIIIYRLYLPETSNYLERKRVEASKPAVHHIFFKEMKVCMQKYWLSIIYLILLCAGMNFMSHGTQDLYPTLLENSLEFSKDQVTITQVVANLGAMLGGTLTGYYSQYLGRRLSIMSMCVIAAALVYPYCYLRNVSIMAAAFFMQMAVQGAWGVIPIHLMELSPPGMITTAVGTSNQLGNLVSSASSTIEAKLGENFPLGKGASGEMRFDYGRVLAIFAGCVFTYVFLIALVGPENHGRDLSVHGDEALAEVIGADAIRDEESGGSVDGDEKSGDKGKVEQREIATPRSP